MDMTGDEWADGRNGKTPAAAMTTKPFVADEVVR